MTPDVWLTRHPYLQPVADLEALVDSAAAELSIAGSGIPAWDDYIEDFHAGVPLLRSSAATIDLQPAARMVTMLVERLATRPLPGKLRAESRTLNAELRCTRDAPHRAVTWLLHKDSFTPSNPGLLRYVGWTVLARHLSPVVGAFGSWRDEECWLRSYCPTCGAPPAMAQLVGNDPGRLRLLACGCCHTRWRYRRTGCPFCENQDDHRLVVLAVEGEGGLRIDYCEACGGYLKTYNGEGSEDLLLRDWTSLHLDVVARDRGLKRLAASLYSLPV
jgi:FdhE protein